MKRWRWFFVVSMVLCLLVSGCASMGQVLKEVVWPNLIPIPPPQSGLVLPINENPGVWAECWLFEGSISERDLILPHPSQRGRLMFAKRPIKHFVINPPMSRPYSSGIMSTAITVPLLLSAYPADYTLLVFHKNFRDWVVSIETIPFSTTGYPLNDYYVSGGRRVYADVIIRLAQVSPYEYRQFIFHRTFYPGHALKDALGLP